MSGLCNATKWLISKVFKKVKVFDQSLACVAWPRHLFVCLFLNKSISLEFTEENWSQNDFLASEVKGADDNFVHILPAEHEFERWIEICVESRQNIEWFSNKFE